MSLEPIRSAAGQKQRVGMELPPPTPTPIPAALSRLARSDRVGRDTFCGTVMDTSPDAQQKAIEAAAHALAQSAVPPEQRQPSLLFTLSTVSIQHCLVRYDGHSPSGHLLFDRLNQISGGLQSGNVSTKVQEGEIVTSPSDLLRMQARLQGHLRRFDGPLDRSLQKRAMDALREHGEVIVYALMHMGGIDGQTMIEHGWLLTTRSGDLLGRFDAYPGARSARIMDLAQYVLTHQHEQSLTLLNMVDWQVLEAHPMVRERAIHLMSQRDADECALDAAQRPRFAQ